ncbi:uncharacterized protein LOC144094321 [Amblyomma americanum]
MQVLLPVFTHVLLPVLAAACVDVRPRYRHHYGSHEADTNSVTAADVTFTWISPPPGSGTIRSSWEIQSPQTSCFSPPIKDRPWTAAPCGLGSCATARTSNPLVFAMQVLLPVFTHVLLPVLAAACVDVRPRYRHHYGSHEADTNSVTAADVTFTWISPPPGSGTIRSSWEIQSPQTSCFSPPIKDRPWTAAPCGLGSCATARTSNPLVFAMQVRKSYSLFAKKSSNYFLIQLPSPQCCTCIVVECFAVVHSLLMQSGDIETNPGPDTAAILAELQKLTSGQSTLISEVKDLSSRLVATDKSITELSKRITELETHYQDLASPKTEVESIKTDAATSASQISNLESRVDDAENRSRSNNLLFYGLPDTSSKETSSESEELVTRLCSENLDITIDPKEIERAHRLGRHSSERCRPIIVKFTFHKTEESILKNARKLKDTDYSIGEDFSHSVRKARKHLLRFAKETSDKYALRFKTLYIGPKQYIFDDLTETVKEVP